MTIILEPRQTLLPLVGGLFLFAGRGLHPPGAFGYRFHVLGPEGLGAHQAAPGCGEDRSFHLKSVEVQKSSGGFACAPNE